MGKFDGVLLVSDFDDTFYHSRGCISERNRAAIAYFQAGGGRFTLATGRVYQTMTPQVEKQGLRFSAPVILANGAQVYDYERSRFLRKTYLPGTAALDVQTVLDAFPGLVAEVYCGEETYISGDSHFARAHMVRVGMEFPVLSPGAMPQPWFKVLLLGGHATLLAAQRLVLERWGDRYEAVFSNRVLLELTAKGSTKGGAALWLADRLGIARTGLYCIGDNQNDIPMLAVSAIPFAPENCAPEVRAFGARIVRSCDDDAVAAVIETLDGIY